MVSKEILAGSDLAIMHSCHVELAIQDLQLHLSTLEDILSSANLLEALGGGRVALAELAVHLIVLEICVPSPFLFPSPGLRHRARHELRL